MTTRQALTLVLTVAALGGMSAPSAAQRVTDTEIGSCVFSWGAGHCVRQYRYGDPANNAAGSLREPNSQDVADARERERRWVERCRPELFLDGYGVGRYVYAARGCEFGQDRD